jgi:hypothetical protein
MRWQSSSSGVGFGIGTCKFFYGKHRYWHVIMEIERLLLRWHEFSQYS